MTAYRELRVVANGDHIDLLEEILFLSEAVSVTLDDDGDTPILEPPLGTHPVWPRTVVIAAYHDTRSDQVILADLSRSLVATGLQIELPKQLTVIADEDWVRISLDQFQPTEIGGFWVVPTWHAVPDHAHGPVLRLDPGLAFGTGYHPTTALCLAWLASADLAGRALLDFGAGSGILAIAGGLRGASPLVALDIDPQALDASAHNAQLNDLSLTCCLPDALPLQQFDVVIVNPPYINISNLKPDEYRLELRNKFRSAKNKSDTYAFFLEQGFNLLKSQGTLSYIIPQTWKATDSFSKLREIIFKDKSISKIVDLEFGTFDAIVKPMVVVISNAFGKYSSIEVFNDSFEKTSEIKISEVIKDSTLSINTTLNKEQKRVFQVIEKDSVPLENIIQFSRGIKTSDDSRFIHTSAKNKDYKKVFRGKNIKGFEMNWNGEYVWYRPDLMKEKVGSVSHTKEFFEVPQKLVTQRVNSSMQLLCAYDDNRNYFLDTTNVSRYETWDKKTSLKYLCAILNSKVINYWYCNKYLMPTIGIYEMHTIPIKKAKDQKPFITIVDKILKAKEENAKPKHVNWKSN